jgi:hypothetical protein
MKGTIHRNRPALSGNPTTDGQRGRQSPSSEAAAYAMQTYWSALGRVWAIEALVARTPDAVERHALEQLRIVEERRAATAQDVLAEIWGIPLGTV